MFPDATIDRFSNQNIQIFPSGHARLPHDAAAQESVASSLSSFRRLYGLWAVST
jgi:hypothetical protein